MTDKDFIDEAVERTYKKMLYKATQRCARLNKRKQKRKIERQNRKRGRR